MCLSLSYFESSDLRNHGFKKKSESTELRRTSNCSMMSMEIPYSSLQQKLLKDFLEHVRKKTKTPLILEANPCIEREGVSIIYEEI